MSENPMNSAADEIRAWSDLLRSEAEAKREIAPQTCPWCGAPSHFAPSYLDRVECSDPLCAARGPTGDSRMAAIAAWNRIRLVSP